ncbi:Ectopic P granules protein [Phytophthora cactorum]|nr:Ectopic P granules protein [Phytophthora cactorum]
MDEYKKKIDLLVKKVWTLEKKEYLRRSAGGDNVEIEQQMEFQTAKLETLQLERLKTHLDKLRQLRTVEASIHTFDRHDLLFPRGARRWDGAEDQVLRLWKLEFHEVQAVVQTVRKLRRGVVYPPSSVSSKSNEWFTSVLRFRQSLQKWISTCLQSLMRTKSLQNMPYLLMHVMYLPRISTDERSWFLRFLQFPRAMVRTDGSLRNEWSEDLVDHYIAMLHLVFHPEKLRRMSILVSSGPPNGRRQQRVQSLAASCQSGTSDERHDLVSVAVHELFMAGYTVEPCQQALGENGERAAGPLSTICLAHPWVLSLLITLLFKFHECAATWIHIFETFPINRWMPTPQDLLNLQEWLLLEDTTAPRSALARFLLDHINWEYDVKLQRLFTDAMLHRQVALMVAEALVLYKTRKERASDPESAIVLSGGGSPQKLEVTSIAKSIRRALWLGETVDFEKWCWKLMLKLRFYSPKSHEPLLPLIDLRHDRSREALTLRRWFAGASVLRVLPSRKVFPFYTSLEEQVSHYGGGDSDRRSTADPAIGGSTGAPIQQEARLLLTPQNPRGMDIESTSEFFPAAIKVLENLFPILSRLDKTKDFSAESESESKTATSNSEDDAETALSSDEVEAEENGGVLMGLDNELESMRFWVKALLRVPFWYENAAFRHVLDVMLHCSMESSYDCLLTKNATSNNDVSDILYELVALIEAAFDAFCQRIAQREEDAAQPEQQFLENEPVIVMSFLPAAAASATFASIFGGSFDVAQEPVSIWSYQPDSLSQYKIYRWCNYCLDLPESEPTQIIYWQVFFALYFATAGGSHVFGHHFLDRTGRRSKRAQVVLTATGGSGSRASVVWARLRVKERKYAHFVALSQLYTAMDAWMEEKTRTSGLRKKKSRVYLVTTRWSDSKMSCVSVIVAKFPFRSDELVSVSDDNDDSIETATPLLSTPLASVGEEDDFAFVKKLRNWQDDTAALEDLQVEQPHHPTVAFTVDLCGPSSLTQLPTVSVVISKDRCVITPSIPLNKAGLKAVAMKFSENLSVLVALDSEMVDSVSQLYISKARTVTQSLPCPEGTNCSSPAAFKFEFLEWMMDSRMDDTIQSIRAQGERCDMRSMLVTNVMSSLNDHDGHMHQKDGIAVSSTTSFAAEQFLQLDGDGFVLSLQILLIDQVVRTLGMEHEKLQRMKKTLENEAPLDLPSTEETVEDSKEDEGKADESEELSPIQKTEQEVERLHSKGLEWFRLLTELDTKLSRMVPPLREALWRSIKQLGLSFVCIDERETCTLLQLMLEDPSRINLLSECFSPAAAPSRFVEMFAKLMSASSSSKLSSEEKLTLLRRFDFRAWLQTKSPLKPTKFDRDTVLCMILGDISHQFPADRSLVDTGRKAKDTTASKHLDEVLRVYAKVLQLICSAHLEDHVEKMVHALVGVHDDYRFQTSSVGTGEPTSSSGSGDDSSASGLTALPRPVDAVVWEALVGIPLTTWKELPVMQVETCVSFLSQHMTSLRWQGGLSSGSSSTTGGGELLRGREASSAASASLTNYPIVYWQRLGVLKSFLDLFTLCCRVAPEQQQWELITAFFEPLLSTLYQPATNTEGSAISAPWSQQDTLSTGTTICSCFVATCSEYLKSQPLAGPRTMISSSSSDTELTQTAKLSQIWSFYLTVLVPHAPTHICKHFHQFVTRLAWEHWCLTLEIVQQMRELVQTEKQQLTGATTGASVPPLHSTLSPYPFVSWLVRDVLCRTTWKSTDAWLEAQSESVCSSFLLEFAKLCLELVLDMPHFQVKSGHAASTNVLPPYFVNFIKQQSVFWAKWKMTVIDLETLQQFTLEALKEPLGGRASSRSSTVLVSTGPFPAAPSAAMMQDAFTRLQLVLRLIGQITTMHHDKLPKPESLQRVNLFLKLLFGVFEVNDRGCLDGNRYTSDHAAWLMVLYGASCTALYEKLDEIVHFYKPENGKGSGGEGVDVSKEGVSEEDLTATIEAVLRFCNLSLVEVFFKQMQSSPTSGSGGGGSSSSSSGSGALNWNKCGNVVFVEIDALVRDFASSQKALQQQSSRSHQSGSDRLTIGKEESSRDTTVCAAQSPAEAIGTPLGKVLWSFLAFRGGELACLAACGRALASVHVMSQVAEKSIEKWIIEERRGMWDALALRLQVPELSGDEFESACLEQGKLLTLQVLFLQQLRRAPVLTESLSLALLTKLMSWMERARVGRSALAQMKLLFLAAEVTNFVCKPLAEVLPSTLKKQMLRQLCDLLLELGHARRNNGIMKAIGLGGSLKYGVEFHVSCLAAGVFLRLQTRNGAPLRVDDRIPFKMTRTTEKHLKSLETMLQSKDAFQLEDERMQSWTSLEIRVEALQTKTSSL